MANNPTITAAEFNAIAAYYNSELGTSIANVAVNDPISATLYSGVYDTVSTAAALANRFIALPPKSHFVRGGLISKEMWGDVGDVLTSTIVSSDANGSWTVPAGVSKIMFNWLVGASGGGGAGTQLGNGGGGAGGGSGGFHHYVELPVKTGDKLTWTIGAGGLGAAGVKSSSVIPNATPGGDTILMINSQEVLRAGGGRPGQSALSTGILTAGGIGGNPNGLTGQAGRAGTSDSASSYGAAGAPGPMAGSNGGAGGTTAGGDPYGTGSSCGKAGAGYGSGGGGGGSHDRQGSDATWSGGNGQRGYIEFAWPSQGAVGGSPAQDNTAYSAVITGTGGGGYTGNGTGNIGSGNSNGDRAPF